MNGAASGASQRANPRFMPGTARAGAGGEQVLTDADPMVPLGDMRIEDRRYPKALGDIPGAREQAEYLEARQEGVGGAEVGEGDLVVLQY